MASQAFVCAEADGNVVMLVHVQVLRTNPGNPRISQHGRGMFKENQHLGYRNVPWVQSSLRDQCSTAHQDWILDRGCKSMSQCSPLAQGCDGLQLG